MKITKCRFLLLIALAGLALARQAMALSFTNLYSFSGAPYGTNSDGARPYSNLIISGNTLYGTTVIGGSSREGTVFAINTDGRGFINLHTFNGLDGSQPRAGLILLSDTLYGTTSGDPNTNTGYGTVFKLKTNGDGFTTLHSFTYYDGANPSAGLVLSSNTLYGATTSGGAHGRGTIFKVNTDGTGFTNLHSFAGLDGFAPYSTLFLAGKTLYGTTIWGGAAGNGTLFRLQTDGTGFASLYSFTASFPPFFTNSDGSTPSGGLVLSGSTLYGTATAGGSVGQGTLFKLQTDGTGYTMLRDFNASATNAAHPSAALILAGNTLYGTAVDGGAWGYGTIFAINADGKGFTNLYSFTPTSTEPPSSNSDGTAPFGSLLLSDKTLYGTAEGGGSSGWGTVFALKLVSRPRLTITCFGPSVMLSWPTNDIGFTLECTPDPASPDSWTTVSPPPLIVSGQNTVTNAVSGAKMFYRLSQ